MFELFEALAAYPIWTVILITVASIIIILKLINWSKAMWSKRQKFQEQAFQKGKQEQVELDKAQKVHESEEQEIQLLKASVAKLIELQEKQQKQIELLIASDELDIKAWIQQQHEKWMALKGIDSQSLDLVLQRYEIYDKEGGNGWAKKMVDDIKALPVITIIPISMNQQ